MSRNAYINKDIPLSKRRQGAGADDVPATGHLDEQLGNGSRMPRERTAVSRRY